MIFFQGFRLVFTFRKNPFFKDTILTKQFSLEFIDQSENLNEYGPLKVVSSKAYDIPIFNFKKEPFFSKKNSAHESVVIGRIVIG